MTTEQINKLHELECQLNEEKVHRRWMDDWGKTLFDNSDSYANMSFSLSIKNSVGKFVLQREIAREDVEMEFNARLREINDKIERLEKEIAEL